tara:strand:+ start:213 stop:548 length:336 start_codon:yes stop_codon:yes gene_type:complete
MFIVESIEKIRRMYHVEKKSIKAITRELKISKNTVRKIIRSDATEFALAKYTKNKQAFKLNYMINDQIINVVEASIYWKDLSGKYLGCNEYMEKMSGVNRNHKIPLMFVIT